MLPSGFSLATFASLIIGTSCSNDFVTSKFPSELQQNKTIKFYWENLSGYIAGIRVYSPAQDSDSDSNTNWILAPNCPDSDSDSDSPCTAYANNGSASFSGHLANGTQLALGSGYELVLLWTSSESYSDIDDDTSEVTSPTFSVVPGESSSSSSGDGGSAYVGDPGMSKAAKTGIAIAVILVVMILLVVLWRYTVERRRRRRNEQRRFEGKDEEKGHDETRWPSTAAARNPGTGRDTQENWPAAPTDLPSRPRPTAGRSLRDMSKRAGRLYLDHKAELPGDPATSPPHRLDTHGLANRAAAAAAAEPEAPRAPAPPVAPVELPTEPPRRQQRHASWRPRTAAGTTFVYDPRPPYALRPPASPYAETPLPVSPLSPASAGSGGGGAMGPIDDSVSPLTPISRKPVGGGLRSSLGLR